MGFPKGAISLSRVQDIPLLLQVLHSQFITHDQLLGFMSRGVPQFSRASFNWRVRRLVDSGFMARQCIRAVSPKPIYSITYVVKLTLADHCTVRIPNQ